MQDVFIVVQRRLEDFRGGPIRPWIFGILARTVSQYWRTHRRHTGRYVQFDCTHLSDPEQASPSEVAETAERMRLVASLLAELSEEQRVLLLLADFEEWKLRELSEYFATSIGTIHSRLTAARQRFSRAYARAKVKHKNSSSATGQTQNARSSYQPSTAWEEAWDAKISAPPHRFAMPRR